MSFMFNPYPYDDSSAINAVDLPVSDERAIASGNSAVVKMLAAAIEAKFRKGRCVIAIDGYVGAEFQNLVANLAGSFPGAEQIDVASIYKGSDELEAMLAESLPLDREIDPVLLFGKLAHRELESLFDDGKLSELKHRLSRLHGIVILFGHGSTSFALKKMIDIRVFLDVAPLNAALKIKNGRTKALGDEAGSRQVSQVFRRVYYYDYEIMVAQREKLIATSSLDFYIDANQADNLKGMPFKSFKALLDAVASQPFRCKPVYLEGVWGGFFIKRLRNLPRDMKNCAWVFDLIPNEVSLLVKAGGTTLEIPFPTLFRGVPEKLMGKDSVSRFGSQFPIRFNYDDTYQGGGNMSIQVHPPAEYAKKRFGEPFQQDESYYIVATAGSKTYLGLQDDCDIDEFYADIRKAENEHVKFNHDRYVNSFESSVGDQYLMPGGTIHASGWNQVVLEIGSCTVGSYTFKLYDYLRSDLNGVARPIHSKHGMNVLNSSCRRSKIDGVLRPAPAVLREGKGWRELLLGENEKIFFSLRRLDFETSVEDDTDGRFHVLVLVEGDSALVCSKADPKRCYKLNHCDMAVVPASLGKYTIINLGKSPCKATKTLLK